MVCDGDGGKMEQKKRVKNRVKKEERERILSLKV